MPIYAYRCTSCGVQFEQHQSFNDDPLVICPECNEPALKKLIQPVGIVFKGSGFYVTDNRSASKSGLDSSRGSKSESSSDTSKETKSEASESKSSSSESKAD
ncbi:MAG: FmdB family zinc ribbon protein [Anaerolineales bacterium]